ncbi:MAG: hypothetical protein JWM49_392 [Microbacteriaceae bacterium]|nr:hypothetical protein [Microbacteriaceae bacterium]
MIIDSYLHLGMPRFQRLSDAVTIMDQYNIKRAIVCAFETDPDLATVHRAIVEAPERFIGAGLPLGADRAEVTAGIHAQFDAGFSGLRLSGEHVSDSPWILDLIGERGGFALICGSNGLAENAAQLLEYLGSHEDGLVIGGHFAGPRETAVFDTDPYVASLFAHPRFVVNFSRHGPFPDDVITPWGRELISRVGWDRILWASEAPVLHWRDETIDTAMAWIDRFSPTPEQREAFFGGNAERIIWGRRRGKVAPLELPFDPFDHLVVKPAPMWPTGLDLDDHLAGRIMAGWLDWGGPTKGIMRDYLESVLDESLPAVEPR